MIHLSQHMALVSILALSLAACDENPSSSGGNKQVPCQEPRPEICTSIYDPVCATMSDGTQKTYASDCTACSVDEVVSYIKGACGV